jgi:hypothetical protein
MLGLGAGAGIGSLTQAGTEMAISAKRRKPGGRNSEYILIILAAARASGEGHRRIRSSLTRQTMDGLIDRLLSYGEAFMVCRGIAKPGLEVAH